MNYERIRELAEQADWWKPLGLPSDWNEGDYVVSSEQMDKFAELIVRECQYAIVSRTDLPKHERKLYNNILKEHFGVE